MIKRVRLGLNHLRDQKFKYSFQDCLNPICSCDIWFKFPSDTHNYEESWSSHANLHKPSYRTKTYGKNYMIVDVIES